MPLVVTITLREGREKVSETPLIQLTIHSRRITEGVCHQGDVPVVAEQVGNRALDRRHRQPVANRDIFHVDGTLAVGNLLPLRLTTVVGDQSVGKGVDVADSVNKSTRGGADNDVRVRCALMCELRRIRREPGGTEIIQRKRRRTSLSVDAVGETLQAAVPLPVSEVGATNASGAGLGGSEHAPLTRGDFPEG